MMLLTFDDDGRCTAESRDGLVTMGNYQPASGVAALGARLHPANERDRQTMLRALADWRQYLDCLLSKPWPKKPSSECKQRRNDLQRGIRRIDAETKRLNINGALSN